METDLMEMMVDAFGECIDDINNGKFIFAANSVYIAVNEEIKNFCNKMLNQHWIVTLKCTHDIFR